MSNEEYCATICAAARSMGIGMLKMDNHYIWSDMNGMTPPMKTPEEEDPKKRLKLACEMLVEVISITK